MTDWDTITPYHRGFREFAQAFEAVGFEDIHRHAIPFLPAKPGLLLDVGAGSGRDAAWFAARGWEVVAAEPATALRSEAARLHALPEIRWLDDSLPSLAAVHRLGLAFDVIWLSGVWMHVQPDHRSRAMRKLATLLRPGGRLVMTLRHGREERDRPMWPVSAHEVERLGLDMGLALRVATEHADDLQGRPDVRWQTVVLDLPDDGVGTLPLLRGVILRQEKSATYKLALLRCIARIADASANVAQEADDDVVLPLGLVALYWIRMFKPLVERGLPQRQGEGMGFVTPAFDALRPLAPQDLQPGMPIGAPYRAPLRQALADAARLIHDMPARHLTYADDTPVFTTHRQRARAGEADWLSQEFLWEYGTVHVPLAVWHALRRMSAWIEPMLLAEWVRLTRFYAERRNRPVSSDAVLDALRWIEPERDTALVRGLVQRRLARGEQVRCVWTGRPLATQGVHIDHCLPWSAWPCSDLWNLLPASARANQDKSGRIVTAAALAEARPRVIDWWQRAYLDAGDGLQTRFAEEARTTLPVARSGLPDLEELFQALDFRRLRLRQDTQLAEWPGLGSARSRDF